MRMLLRRSKCFMNTSYERLPNVPSVRQMWMWSSRKPSGVGMLQSLSRSVSLSYLCLRVTCLATAHSVLVIVSWFCLNVKFVAKLWCIIKIFCFQCASFLGFLWRGLVFFFPAFPIEILWKEWGVCEKYYGLWKQNLLRPSKWYGKWEMGRVGYLLCYAGILSVY